jgi:hypothetical protein
MSGQRIESPSTRSNGDSNQFGPARVSLPHDIYRSRTGLEPTYINPHSALPKPEPVYTTWEHNTPPLYATAGGSTGWVHATLTISHAQCVIVFSSNGIAEILGLPEHVARIIKSWSQQAYNERSLTDTGGALRQDSILGASKESAWSQIKFMIIIKTQDQPWV